MEARVAPASQPALARTSQSAPDERLVEGKAITAFFRKREYAGPILHQDRGDFAMTTLQVAAFVVLQSVAAFAQPQAVQTSETLPPRIAALVPEGMKVVYQRITSGPTLAAAEFSVEKSLPEYHTLTYTCAMNAYETKSPLWSMQQPIYKQQVDEKIAKESQYQPNADLVEAAPATVTSYGWGSGIARRLTHHPPQSKEYVDYECVYFGMIGGVTFDLHVSGLQGGCEAADQWAESVAATAAKTSVSNIAEK